MKFPLFSALEERIYTFSNHHPRLFPDALFLRIVYYHITGERLHLKKPQKFNEKLQWLKLNDRREEYTALVDKFEVKKHVEKIIGNKYIIPTLAVYDRVEEIDFNALPDQFVLKCTHDSGGVVICKDKKTFDRQAAIDVLRDGLSKNFYLYSREWPYKNVVPRIIAEKYLVDESGKELKDYKIFCFEGEPKIVQVDYDRFSNHRRILFDTDWNRLPFTLGFPTDWECLIPRPKGLEEMLDVARQLSKGIPHVRVDLYNIGGEIFFGELTFYHGSGLEKFTPESWNVKFGNWIKII